MVVATSSFSASGQTTSVVGEVVLSGTPDAPVICNNSDRNIVGYVLRFEDANGHHVTGRMLFLQALRHGLNAGISPGMQRTFSSQAEVRRAGQTTPNNFTGVVLDAVLFADGQFIGPDTTNAFDDISAILRKL
jgi:hypothetical protein